MPDSLVALISAGPSCGACGGRAVVQWQRRPTAAELEVLVAAEQARRAEVLLLADRSGPAPVFGPLPTAADVAVAVFGCAEHTIGVEHAARVHGADCTAPHPDHLPLCDCEPEPAPPAEDPFGPTVTLPSGWTVPAPTAD